MTTYYEQTKRPEPERSDRELVNKMVDARARILRPMADYIYLLESHSQDYRARGDAYSRIVDAIDREFKPATREEPEDWDCSYGGSG